MRSRFTPGVLGHSPSGIVCASPTWTRSVGLGMTDEKAKLQQVVDGLVGGREGIRVLEAGCGLKSRIRRGRDWHVVGIDISEEQLERNRDLDEKILGDVQDYVFPPSHFDLVVCWNVLEHLPCPDSALRHFAQALNQGGLIVLAGPNPASTKGLVTKFTPHWFHVWAYRHLLGSKAGKEGRGPFRTYMRWSLTPSSIERYAIANGLSVEYLSLYEAAAHRRLRRDHAIIGLPVGLLSFIVKRLSGGRRDPILTEYIAVLRRGSGQEIAA